MLPEAMIFLLSVELISPIWTVAFMFDFHLYTVLLRFGN